MNLENIQINQNFMHHLFKKTQSNFNCFDRVNFVQGDVFKTLKNIKT